MPNSKPPKEVLKDVVKKPIQLGHWLKKNKFASAENISKEGAWSEGESVGKESTPSHQRNHHQGHKRTQSGHVGGNWGASGERMGGTWGGHGGDMKGHSEL